jgi:HlyD family secretion protein
MTELDPAVASIIVGQDKFFIARLTTLAEATRSLEQQKLQIRNEIVGQRAQIKALDQQLLLVETDLLNSEALLDEGLVESARVTSLKRERASLAGQNGELEAAIARNLGRIAQIDIDILGLSTRQREQALAELRDVEPRIAVLTEELHALHVKLGRLTLTAPTEGIVHDMRVHSRGAVIRPAEPVLFIVPQDEELTIAAKIDIYHIDQVSTGSPVTLRFSAFNVKTTPEISAQVSRVSADVTTDERTGLQFYSAEVKVSREEIARLGGHALLPGMPVEVFIKTGERSPLSYFGKPFTDYFDRAFRE